MNLWIKPSCLHDKSQEVLCVAGVGRNPRDCLQSLQVSTGDDEWPFEPQAEVGGESGVVDVVGGGEERLPVDVTEQALKQEKNESL